MNRRNAHSGIGEAKEDELLDRPLAAYRRSRLTTVFATLIVLVSLLLPGDEIPDMNLFGLDKIAHILLFGFWALSLRFDWTIFRKKPALIVLAVALFGPLTEVGQLFVPGRSFDILDMAADLAGAALAMIFGARIVDFAEKLIGGRRGEG